MIEPKNIILKTECCLNYYHPRCIFKYIKENNSFYNCNKELFIRNIKNFDIKKNSKKIGNIYNNNNRIVNKVKIIKIINFDEDKQEFIYYVRWLYTNPYFYSYEFDSNLI